MAKLRSQGAFNDIKRVLFILTTALVSMVELVASVLELLQPVVDSFSINILVPLTGAPRAAVNLTNRQNMHVCRLIYENIYG